MVSLLSFDRATVSRTGKVYWVPLSGHAQSRLMYWPATSADNSEIILVLPGASEFIEKYFEVAHDLLNRGYGVAILDWRGQGLATRPLPNRQKHHYESFDILVDDLDRVVRFIARELNQDVKSILAHSMGGHIALRYLAEHSNYVQKAVLCAPMIDINYGRRTHRFLRFLIRFLCFLGFSRQYAFGQGDYGEKSKSQSAMAVLTSDRARFEITHNYIAENKSLSIGGKTFGWLDAANRSIDRLKSCDFSHVKSNILVVQAGSDKVVVKTSQRDLVARLPNARLISIEGAQHEILQECDVMRNQFWNSFDTFMSAQHG